MTSPLDTELIPKETLPVNTRSTLTNILKSLECDRQHAAAIDEQNKAQSKSHYDKTAKELHFQIGDKVALYTPKVKTGLTKKLHKPWQGPFLIDQVQNNNTYKI